MFPTSSPEKTQCGHGPRQRFLVLLIYLAAGCSPGFCNENVPTLYERWRPVANAYDTLTITVTLGVDQNTPDGLYSIRSEQTTNPANHSDHTFTVTDGVASISSFTVGNYPLLNPGVGATGIILWVKDAPTDIFATVTETYNYIDGGFEPDYFAHHSNPQIDYTDSLLFSLAGEVAAIESVQAVPEPATWITGVLTGATAMVMARRRRRARDRRSSADAA